MLSALVRKVRTFLIRNSNQNLHNFTVLSRFRRFQKKKAYAEQVIWNPATGELRSLDIRVLKAGRPLWLELKWGDEEFHLARRVEYLQSLVDIARAEGQWKLVLPGGVRTVQGKTTVIDTKKFVKPLEECSDVGYLVTERALANPPADD